MDSEALIRKFRAADLVLLHGLVVRTVQTSYPSYYSPEAVQFFCDHHAEKNILADASNGTVLVLLQGDIVIGTGTRVDAEIKRVFVEPSLQGSGYGGRIMDALEGDAAFAGLSEVELDASLPAKRFYDGRGYVTLSSEAIPLGKSTLPYFRMRKSLSRPR